MPRKSWWARLPFGVRMTAGACALLVLIGVSTGAVAAMTRHEPRIVTTVGQDAPVAAPAPLTIDSRLGTETAEGVDRTPTRTDASGPPHRPKDQAPAAAQPRRAADPEASEPARGNQDGAAGKPADAPAAPVPVVTTRLETETRAIPFRTRLVRDPDLPRGRKRVRAPGVPGAETLHYLTTYSDDRQTDRRLVDSVVTRQPQPRVVAFGIRRGPDDGIAACEDQACPPRGRSASCPEDIGPAVQESGALPIGGSVAVLDGGLYVLPPTGADGLALDPALLCEVTGG